MHRSSEYLDFFVNGADFRSRERETIRQIGSLIDAQRALSDTFLNPLSERTHIHSRKLQHLVGNDFAINHNSVCSNILVCNLNIFYDRVAKRRFRTFEDFTAYLVEKYNEKERQISRFLQKDSRLMIGARPEHHVYPVFESLRKSALGERLYAQDTNRIFDSRNLSHPQSLDNDGIERLVDEMERSNSTAF